MLKAAGLYIEKAKPVVAGPFAQEVIPPSGSYGGFNIYPKKEDNEV